MAARRRSAASRAVPPDRLSDRTPDAWLTAAEIEHMRDLLNRAARADAFDAHKLRQEAWRDFHGASGHAGTTAQLIAWWADERRQRACTEWVRAHPGSKLTDFGPFLDGIET